MELKNLNSIKDKLYREKYGIPETTQVDPIKTEKAIQKANSTSPEEKRDWEAPHYDTIQEMEEAIPGLIESLSAEDPNIRYGSKKAVHNYRELIKNMGDLYRDYLMTY